MLVTKERLYICIRRRSVGLPVRPSVRDPARWWLTLCKYGLVNLVERVIRFAQLVPISVTAVFSEFVTSDFFFPTRSQKLKRRRIPRETLLAAYLHWSPLIFTTIFSISSSLFLLFHFPLLPSSSPSLSTFSISPPLPHYSSLFLRLPNICPSLFLHLLPFSPISSSSPSLSPLSYPHPLPSSSPFFIFCPSFLFPRPPHCSFTLRQNSTPRHSRTRVPLFAMKFRSKFRYGRKTKKHVKFRFKKKHIELRFVSFRFMLSTHQYS